MDNGSSDNRRGIRGGSGVRREEQPQDAQVGDSSREQREQMDEKFRQAFERALRSSQESRAAAAATARAERR
jgi:hypothetical protein